MITQDLSSCARVKLQLVNIRIDLLKLVRVVVVKGHGPNAVIVLHTKRTNSCRRVHDKW